MSKELLTSVFMRLRPRLETVARRILSDDAAALDALQDAFYNLWKRPQAPATENEAEGMTVVTVKNVCLDVLRRRNSHPASPLEPSLIIQTDEEMSDRSDLLEEITEIIENSLNERQRDILYLRDRHGYDIDAIAEKYGISEANTRLILSRARRTVRECYMNRNKKAYEN